jgi:serine/threonine-protein kinase
MFCSRCGTQVETSSRFCPTCGLDLTTVTGAGQSAAATAAMAAAPPQQDETEIVRQALKDEYELEKELGRGGMAVVYKARDKQLDREVAIKVLPFSLSFDAEFVERFQREARTAGRLEHPNIIPIYRVGKSGRVIYFVMKFIRGKSLSSVIETRGALPVPEIKRVLIECTRALGYAHKHGIVHRDIKPDNIMFDELGQAIVTDFGIAKAQSGAKLTGTGMSIGTPHYMSPEQARAQNLDGRSDMYSLGVVAYQCLTGHVPFDGEDSFSIGYKHIMEELPTPPLETADQHGLFGVIQRMMAKKPDDRFQAAEELIAALEGAAGGVPTMDMATMPTRAIEPVKPPAAGAKAPPPMALQATTPLPRASVSEAKPKLEEEEKPKAPPPERKKAPPPRRPPEKSKAPIYVAASLAVVVLGLGGYYLGVMRPAQQRAQQTRADSVRNAQQLAQTTTTTPADTARATRDTAKAATTTPPREPARTARRDTTVRITAPATREGTIRLGGTIPRGASVTVDGQPKAGTAIPMPAGRYTVRVTATGFQDFTQQVTVVAGRPASVKVRMLQQLAGTTTPTTTPQTTTTTTTPPPTGGAPPPQCASNPSFSLANRGNACYDQRARPRTAPIMPAPESCTGNVTPVTLMLKVSAQGEVDGQPSVSRRSNCDAFTQNASSYALDLTFTPATKNGTPVAVWMNLQIQAQRR